VSQQAIAQQEKMEYGDEATNGNGVNGHTLALLEEEAA
jgi:myosin-5